MVLIVLPFLAFNVYVGACTIQYMNKTIEQREEKLKLLRLAGEKPTF
jgi:hypothetical protein